MVVIKTNNNEQNVSFTLKICINFYSNNNKNNRLFILFRDKELSGFVSKKIIPLFLLGENKVSFVHKNFSEFLFFAQLATV